MLARAAGIERVLIVTLTSIRHQWKGEIARFTGRDATVVQGSVAQRNAQWGEAGFFKIANYDTLPQDIDAIHKWAPDLIILDEAQRIKNWKTRTAQTVKQLRSQHAIVLTGTPLENRLEELHSIVQFIDRYRLGPLFRFLDKHQITDDGGKVVGYQHLGEVTRTLEPVLIRRTKAEVLKDLPGRLDKHLFLPMTPQQLAYHDEYKDVVARLVSKWRKHRFLSDADQRRMQAALQSMRMVCNSTYLLDAGTDSGSKADEVIAHLGELLEEKDAKAVVFSQWVGSHEMLIRRLPRLGVDHAFLHGGIPAKKRGDLIDRFRQDPKCRVFLSTDAGGIGLNLQNASSVLVMDQPWNPALLEQRIGRVHRLGQAKPVNVLHFVSKGTIEEGILDLQKFKRSLFAGVLDGGADEVRLGGTRLQQFMNGVEKATNVQPQAPIEPTTPEPAVETTASTSPPVAAFDEGLTSDALSTLISAGKGLFDQLSTLAATGASPITVDRDAQGRPGIRLNLPDDAALGRAATLLKGLAAALSGRAG